MDIELRIGASSPSIIDQLDEQGAVYDLEEAARWEVWAGSIVDMAAIGIITGTERQRITKRLLKRVSEKLEQHARALRVDASAASSEAAHV